MLKMTFFNRSLIRDRNVVIITHHPSEMLNSLFSLTGGKKPEHINKKVEKKQNLLILPSVLVEIRKITHGAFCLMFKMCIFHISVNSSLTGDKNLITTTLHPSELLNYLFSLTRVNKPGYVNRKIEKIKIYLSTLPLGLVEKRKNIPGREKF